MLDGAVPLSSLVLSGAVVGDHGSRCGRSTDGRASGSRRVRRRRTTSRRASQACRRTSCRSRTRCSPSLLLGALGALRRLRGALDTTTLPFSSMPPRSPQPSRGSSLAIAQRRLRPCRDARVADRARIDEVVVPDQRGAAWPGVKELIVFALIVAAMFLRGASLPTRGELVEQRLPYVPRPRHPFALAIPSTVLCALALVVLPFDFRQALTNSLIGIVMALSLVVITGFVGQVSSSSSRSRAWRAHGVSPCRRRRDRLSAGAARGHRRGRGARPRDGGVGAAGSRSRPSPS